MREDGRNQPFTDLDFSSRISDIFSAYDSAPELPTPENKSTHEPTLDEQVAEQSKFLDTKLAFFSAQQKNLGQHNDEIRSQNGAEETLALELLKAQQETIAPLLEAVTDLDTLQSRLARAETDADNQTLSDSEKQTADELLNDLKTNITRLKQEIAQFDTKNFATNAFALIETEAVTLYAELAEREKEMRKILAEQQKKTDEINVLKSRLRILQAEDSASHEAKSDYSRTTSALPSQSNP